MHIMSTSIRAGGLRIVLQPLSRRHRDDPRIRTKQRETQQTATVSGQKNGASDGIRTHDIYLGKVELYH